MGYGTKPIAPPPRKPDKVVHQMQPSEVPVSRGILPQGGSSGMKPCSHKFRFLREKKYYTQKELEQNAKQKLSRGGPPFPPRPSRVVNVFYCEHCLAHREVDR